MRKPISVILLLFSIATPTFAAPVAYSAGPIEGQVIDAKTKEPVAGVVVVAIWDLEGGMEGGNRIATLKVIEATTDHDGRYRMPGWGPVPRPAVGILDAYDPAILIFKSGYLPKQLLNDTTGPPGRRALHAVHNSNWNGRTIALQMYEGSLKAYSFKVSYVWNSLGNVINGTDCAWKQIPKTIRALVEESNRELAAGVEPSFAASVDRLMDRKNCAPVDEFRKAYQEAM